MLLQGETMGQAQLILGYLGQISACVVLVTPACTTLRDAWNAGTVGERSPLLFLAALFNSGVWILCGRIAANKFVTWLNVIIACVQAVYFSYFLYKSTAAQRWLWMRYFCGALIGYGCTLCFYFAGRTSHFSALCGASGVVLAFIPLLNLPTAWRSVSMLSMPPLPVPLASLINGVVWTSYAWSCPKVLVSLAAPPISNVVSASVQILLHGFCHVLQWPELEELEVCLLDEQDGEV